MQRHCVLNHPTDIIIRDSFYAGNSFSVHITGSFEHENGCSITIPGFSTGDHEWCVRFSPTQLGTWRCTFRLDGHEVPAPEASILCVMPTDAASERQTIRVDPVSGRYFVQENGKPFFMMAYECDWLFALWMKDESAARSFIDKIRSYKFNSIIMNIYAHECTWTKPDSPGRLVPPPLFCWGGSNEFPDHSVLNHKFFERFDGLMNFLLERDIIAHIYFFVYNKVISYPRRGSAEERMYLEQITARYQAYPNLVWDFAKETYLNPDKNHIFECLGIIRSADAYKRLLTVQDDKMIYRDERFSPLLDFVTLQQHQDFNTTAIAAHDASGKPVLNAEFGYESGSLGVKDRTFFESQNFLEYLNRAWEVALSGASTCYYYTFASWDVIRPDDTPPGYAGFARLHDFFTSVEWWKYVPRPDLCLWTPGVCMADEESGNLLLKSNHHGRFLMGIDSAFHDFSGIWMNIFTGEQASLTPEHIIPCEVAEKLTILASPFATMEDDYGYCVLKLKVTKKVAG